MRDSYSGVVRAHILFGNVRLGGLVVELASEIFVLMMTGSSLAGYGNPGRERRDRAQISCIWGEASNHIGMEQCICTNNKGDKA